MTSLDRVLTALGQKEPDKVPLFLLLTFYGAKELGMSIEKYFSKPEYVVEGQMLMYEKYRNDCIYPFFYASLEIEAFGGNTIFIENGPPNAGRPIIDNFQEISKLKAPNVSQSRPLQKVLEAISSLKSKVQSAVPIIGVVMSPFSLPVMQLGFDRYLDLMHSHKPYFEELMHLNETFCVEWANAQLNAGATAICYFDPVSSPTIVPREKYLETGFQIAQRTLKQINGPAAIHFASGRCLPVIEDIPNTGAALIGVSSQEDIGEVKRKLNGKLSVLGNLNGIEMCRWTEAEAEMAIKNIIRKAARGGGLIISDNHGEIPFQVHEKTLLAIGKAVEKWGTYPLNWIENE